MLRDRIQQAAQKGIAVNVVHGNRDGQILFLLAFHMDLGEELVVAKLQRTFEILSQMPFCHFTKLCIAGHVDALLVTDVVQHLLLLRVVDGPTATATAATGGKHQQGHSTYQ